MMTRDGLSNDDNLDRCGAAVVRLADDQLAGEDVRYVLEAALRGRF
jgi:hypothetical protein